MFVPWLIQEDISILACMYKSNNVLCIGRAVDPKSPTGIVPSIWLTEMQKPMALARPTDRTPEMPVWIGGYVQYVRFERSEHEQPDRERPDRSPFDALYDVREIRVVGNIDPHDTVLHDGTVYFVSARFSCVGTFATRKNMRVWWQPPWISKVVGEDRCHLNGLCADADGPRYVTSCSRSDVHDGWRAHRADGGVVWDIRENKLVCAGLSMPHSPRLHNGRIWLLNSGSGHLGYVDSETTVTSERGETSHPFTRVAFVQGFLRGLDFVGGRYAVVGCSIEREVDRFVGLELGETLAREKVSARCGIFVIDLRTQAILHHLTFEPWHREMYDVMAIPHAKRPTLSVISSEDDVHIETDT